MRDAFPRHIRTISVGYYDDEDLRYAARIHAGSFQRRGTGRSRTSMLWRGHPETPNGQCTLRKPRLLARIEALKALQAGPDLIITDVMMPDMDGRQFVSEFRARAKYTDLPVICVTALSNPDVNADAVFTKPVDIGALLVAIDKHPKPGN